MACGVFDRKLVDPVEYVASILYVESASENFSVFKN
jgi:hypothetical protein